MKRFILAMMLMVPLVASAQSTVPSTIPLKGKPHESYFVMANNLRVPILMYHHIRTYVNVHDPMGEHLSVTPETFNTQLTWLEAHGYQFITFDDLMRIKEGTLILVKKPIILTFDDGYENAFTQALPRLVAHHASGVFYIATGLLNQTGYMKPWQVAALTLYGMQIAAHTVHHVDLAAKSEADQINELKESKTFLETLIGKSVLDMAYPYGSYTPQVAQAVEALGYRSATTTAFGEAREHSPMFALPRIRIKEETDFSKILP